MPAILALLAQIPASILNLNFGNIFAGIGKALSALASNIYHYWYVWLIALLIGGNLFFSYEWRKAEAALTKEKAAHTQDINNFKNAQAVANAQAQAQLKVIQKESKANADQADANYSTLLNEYHASLLRYAQSNQGHSQSSSHSQQPTAQSTDRPSSSADLPATVTITGSDAQICAENTARLQAAHDWALQLIKEPNQ